MSPTRTSLLVYQVTTTTYDALGRVVEYEDADGNVAKTTYDLDGRPVATEDAKGSQTLTYDPTSGLPVELEDSAAGSFTAEYDADGNMTARSLPNGLTATTTYNEAGEPMSLSYTKLSSCGESCTWLEEALERSIYGQIVSINGTLAKDAYSYDKSGRLIEAQETPSGDGCTTRAYAYDADSNRQSLSTRGPGAGGVCVTSGGTEQEYQYDGADRLEGEGLVYDNWGRITILPAPYAGGKALSTEYFSTEMVAKQEQDGITNIYALDASLRQRQRVQAGGGLEGTEIFHYDNGGDSLAWAERGSVWTRSIGGVGGELCATVESGSGITFQLTSLHGDVVAAAEPSPTATKLKATYRHDEFGNPMSGPTGRYGWLGGKGRRTELPSGVVQMGRRSYIPEVGRFMSTDPVTGGSASAYDYANQDPLDRIDLMGTISVISHCSFHVDHPHPGSHKRFRGRINAVMRGGCFAADVTYAVAQVRLSIYRNGLRVARTKWKTVYVPLHPSPILVSPVEVKMGSAAPPCRTGNYRAAAEIRMWAPPGYSFTNGSTYSEGGSISQGNYIRC